MVIPWETNYPFFLNKVYVNETAKQIWEDYKDRVAYQTL